MGTFWKWSHRNPWFLWGSSFTLILLAHLAVAAVLLNTEGTAVEQGAEQEALLIDMIATAPQTPEPAAPGPQQQAVTPQPEPAPPEPAPDRLPEQKTELEPTPEPQQEQTAQAPEPEQQIAEKETSRKQGSNVSTQAIKQTWQGKLFAHLERHKRYPLTSQRKKEEGQVKVRFRVNARGEVLETEIVSSSGYPRLDTASLDLFKRASPVPAPPKEIPVSGYQVTVPLEYFLR